MEKKIRDYFIGQFTKELKKLNPNNIFFEDKTRKITGSEIFVHTDLAIAYVDYFNNESILRGILEGLSYGNDKAKTSS